MDRGIELCNEDDFKVVDRPPCPECGGTYTISSSNKWLCGICGKQWMKVRRSRDISGRGRCIYCGEEKLTGFGNLRWLCAGCGRTFKKGKEIK